MSDQPVFRAKVFGTVQNVGYRAWARGEAQSRGLRGWCKNENDGSVTVVVSGDPDALNDYLELLEQGPKAATVDGIQLRKEAAVPNAPGFEIRR